MSFMLLFLCCALILVHSVESVPMPVAGAPRTFRPEKAPVRQLKTKQEYRRVHQIKKSQEAPIVAPHTEPTKKHHLENEMTIISHPPEQLTMEDVHAMSDKELMDYVGDLPHHLTVDNNAIRYAKWLAFDARYRLRQKARARFEELPEEEKAKMKNDAPPLEDNHDETLDNDFRQYLPDHWRKLHSTHRELRRAHGEHVRTKLRVLSQNEAERKRPTHEHVVHTPSGPISAKVQVARKKPTVASSHDWKKYDQIVADGKHDQLVKNKDDRHTSTMRRRSVFEKYTAEERRQMRDEYGAMSEAEQAEEFHRNDGGRCLFAAAEFCEGLMYDFAAFVECSIASSNKFKEHDAHCLGDFIQMYKPCANDMLRHCKNMRSEEVTICLMGLAESDTRVLEAAEKLSNGGENPVSVRALDGLQLEDECRSSELLHAMTVAFPTTIKQHTEGLSDDVKDIMAKHSARHHARVGGHEDDLHPEEEEEEADEF